MSTTVDERVLEMRFDNKQFENNVQTSISTLDKLNQSLNLTGASKGLENISKAAKRVDMSGLSGAIETVQVKFSTLEVMAVTALANITNSAVNAGKRMASALTIDSVKLGFQEYETQINAIQTILANTQGGQAQINQKTVESIKETAETTVEITKQANEEALDNLAKTQKKALKNFKEIQNDEIDSLKDTQTEELDLYEEYANKELEALEEKHRQEQEAVSEANEAELESFQKLHSEKMALYEDEYMEKLRVVDEERYNAIKAIDDEIAAIEAKTEAESKELELAKQNEKIAQLRSKVNNATNSEERMQAEKDLKDYQDELERNRVLEERKEQIEALKNSKDAINEEYDAKYQAISDEYSKKATAEAEDFNAKIDNLLVEQSTKEQQLDEQQQAEKQLLNERLANEKKALAVKQETELEMLQDMQEAKLEAFQEQQYAELKALKNQNELALANIEAEKEAKLKALAVTNTAETKGSTLEDVNKALDELNTYADKTIYNFTEMTRNIGTFTAAGVDLDTSVSAIKGIANLAALSGSNSQQASTAMYQLSQALASGSVKLQDWNSVVNAGMGGKVFQDALKETARVHGIAIDQMIMEEGSFKETLQNGWLTSDILTETLAKFTGDLTEEQLRAIGYTDDQIESIIKMGQTANDAATVIKTGSQLIGNLAEVAQSGWTNSWEYIIGDFEEAKTLWTSISDILGGIIENQANARNELLQGWKALGGRDSVIESVKNSFEGILSIVNPIKDAFREIFPPTTAEQLFAFSEGLREFTSHLKLSDETSDNLKSTFKGFFAVVDIIGQAFSAVFEAMSPLLGGMSSFVDLVLNVTGCLGEWLVRIDEVVKRNDIFNESIQNVIDFIKKLIESVKDFADRIKNKFTFHEGSFELFHSLLERSQERMSQVGEAADGMKSVTVTAIETMGSALSNSSFLKTLQSIWEVIKGVSENIANAFGSLISGSIEKLGNANFDGFLDLISGLSIGGIAVAISKFLNGLSETFDDITGPLKSLTGILDSVRGCFEAYQTKLKADTLIKIATAIAILAASITVISLIDSNKLNASLTAITIMFADLMASMAIFSKTGSDVKGTTKSIAAMLGISTAVLILAGALKTIGDLDTNQLMAGLVGVAGLTTMMVATAKVLGSGSGTVIKGASSMVIFAGAIKILASVCKDLSALNWDELVKGLAGVGGLLTEVSIFLNTAKFSGQAVSTATGILILASAIKILASSCGDFGEMDMEEIGKGLLGIGALLLEITAFTKLTGNAENVISTSVALIAIGAAMKIFATAVKDISNMSWEELARGLTGMAGALLVVTAALNFMPSNMLSTGTGLVAISAALLILSQALEGMGGMNWEEIGKSLTALGGSMVILAIGLNAMNGTLAGSAAMLVASASLAVLTPVLSILGAMSWESIAKGLIALAGAFAVIGVAGLVLTPIVPAILGLAGAFTLIGVGVLGVGAGLMAAGAGLSALAVGLAALATTGAAGATAIVASLTVIITGIAGLIPAVCAKIAEGIIAFCNIIAESAPVIAETVIQVALAVITALNCIIPPLVETIFNIFDKLLSTIAEHAPSMIQSGMSIILAFLTGIRENIGEVVTEFIGIITETLEAIANKIPDIIQAGIDIVIALINGLAQGIEDNSEEIRDAFIGLFESIVEAILVFLGIHSPSKLFNDIGVNMLQGLINGIGGMATSLHNKVVEVVSGMVDTIKNKAGDFISCGKDMLTNIKNGFSSKISDIKSAAGEAISTVLSIIKDPLPTFEEIGGNIISGLKTGLANGIESLVDVTEDVAVGVISTIKNLFGINSPSKVFAEIGKYTDEGFALGLKKYSSKIYGVSKSIGNYVVNDMSTAISKIVDVANKDIDMQPTIRPVIDLSNVTKGADEIKGLFSAQRTIDLAGKANVGMMSSYANNQNGLIVDNDNVVKAIEGLRGDMSIMTDAMGKMQIVMDSGTIVGELTPKIDKSLGKRYIYNERRV